MSAKCHKRTLPSCRALAPAERDHHWLPRTPDGCTEAPRTLNHSGFLLFYRFGLPRPRHTSFQHLPHLRRDLGELRELSVVAGIIGFDVRHINNHRAERRKFGIVGIGSESLFTSGDKVRNRIVVRDIAAARCSLTATPGTKCTSLVPIMDSKMSCDMPFLIRG
jgi:hypothetical protein